MNPYTFIHPPIHLITASRHHGVTASRPHGLTFLLLLLLAFLSAFSQDDKKQDEYFRTNHIRYQDYIYTPNIKTVLLYRQGWEMTQPVLTMGSEEKLNLSFDDLNAGVKSLKYTFIHCDANWNPTNIPVQEYLDGFYEDYIHDYTFSYNTLQVYTHYKLAFPTEDLRIKLSGNYIVLVYPEDDKENPILSARFWVLEPRVKIVGEIGRANEIEDRNFKQKVSFSIFTSGFDMVDPYANLKVIIQQNGRWDNLITNLKPLVVKGDELDYHHTSGNVFNGGNEFRHFDIKTVKTAFDRVKSINATGELYQFELHPDEKRPFKVYISDQDINGQRLIKTTDSENSDNEADYVHVKFFLPYFPFLTEGNLYLMGALTYWQFSKEGMLKYNFERKGYEGNLFLKQGYYNYEYVFLENGKKAGDETIIEGNHYDTENDYSIYVYYSAPGTEYDRLIALEKLNSIRNAGH